MQNELRFSLSSCFHHLFVLLIALLMMLDGSCAVCRKQLVHISETNYEDVFESSYEPFRESTLSCIYNCLKRDISIKVAAYDVSDGLCVCVDRYIDSLATTTENSKLVYVIDLQRTGN